MKLKVLLEPSEEGGFTALVPSLPGCISEGDIVFQKLTFKWHDNSIPGQALNSLTEYSPELYKPSEEGGDHESTVQWGCRQAPWGRT